MTQTYVPPPQRRIILSGCSSGGKTTLLDALARLSFSTVAEPGRRVLAANGPDPNHDPVAFARACLQLAKQDYKDSTAPLAVFDRGLLDAHFNLEARGIASPIDPNAFPFWHTVLMAPPWPEIYVQDADRRHGLDAAMAEYELLTRGYESLGYSLAILPRDTVEARVAFVRARLAQP